MELVLHASMSTRHQSSLQHTVDAARTITSRTANSYSISGSGVDTDVADGTTANNLSGGFKTISSGVMSLNGTFLLQLQLQMDHSVFQIHSLQGDASNAQTNATVHCWK